MVAFPGPFREGEVRAGRLGAHSDAEPGVVLPLESGLHALEAVVTSGGSGAPQTKAAQRQGHFINQNEQMSAGIEIG